MREGTDVQGPDKETLRPGQSVFRDWNQLCPSDVPPPTLL